MTAILSSRTYRAVLLAALATITWLALTPGMDTPGHSDKLNHIAAFLVLAWLADQAFPGIRPRAMPFILLLAYGAGLELVQHTLPYRVASWFDLLTNAVGLGLYISVSFFYTKRQESTP